MRFHRSACHLALATILALAGFGCKTISGHKLVTDPQTGKVTDVQDVKGLPVLVKRPTKAVYIVKRTTYSVTMQMVEGGKVVDGPKSTETEVTISDTPTLLGPTELFTIDPKRPALGTLEYGINMTDGVVTSMTGKIDDQTLKEIRAALKDIMDKAIPTPSVEKQAGALVTRTLASQEISLVIFDLATGAIEVRKL